MCIRDSPNRVHLISPGASLRHAQRARSFRVPRALSPLNIGLHYRKHDLRAVFRRPEAGHEERLAAPAVCITIEHRRVGDDLGQTRRFRHVRVMPAFTLKANIDRRLMRGSIRY